MSRMLAWLVGSSSALLLTAVALPSSASGPTLHETPSPVVDGATVFTDTCAKCHGADGKGETGMGKKAKDAGKKWPDLTKSKVDAVKAKDIIDNGVAGTLMKAYKDKLTPEAAANVRDYVLKLQKP